MQHGSVTVSWVPSLPARLQAEELTVLRPLTYGVLRSTLAVATSRQILVCFGFWSLDSHRPAQRLRTSRTVTSIVADVLIPVMLIEAP